MILPVYLYGKSILRKEADFFDPAAVEGLEEIVQNMKETMKNSEGVGLAAPQVGLGLRLFLINSTDILPQESKELPVEEVFINPEIVEVFGDDFEYEEGCLSIPGIREKVVRKAQIRIKYFDESLQGQEKTFSGFAARIIQHEYDHILGVLFVDKIRPLRKKLIAQKLKRIVRRKVEVKYKYV